MLALTYILIFINFFEFILESSLEMSDDWMFVNINVEMEFIAQQAQRNRWKKTLT